MDDASKHGEFVLGESFAAVLTETTQSLVCVYDRDARILLFNDACERATGFRREEVLGRDAREFVIPHEERDAFGDFLAHVWRTGAPSPQVGHWRTKDGGRRLIAWSNRPMAGKDGAPATLVTTGIDLTDRDPRRDDDDALQGDPEAKLVEVWRLASEQRALRRVATLVATEVEPRARVHRGLGGVRARAAGQLLGGAALRGRRHGDLVGAPTATASTSSGRRAAMARESSAVGRVLGPARRPASTTGAGRATPTADASSASATAPPRRRRSSSPARSGARSRSRARTRCRTTPRTASARSASWSRWRSRARRRART